MTEEIKKKIQEVMGEIQCPKNFKCADNGFERLCKAKDVGIRDYLVCLEDTAWSCSFALSFEDGYMCRCPLRVYLSQELKK